MQVMCTFPVVVCNNNAKKKNQTNQFVLQENEWLILVWVERGVAVLPSLGEYPNY